MTILIQESHHDVMMFETNFLKVWDKLSGNDKRKINARVVEVLSSKFEPKFAKFLNDRLYTISRKVELLKVFKDIEAGDGSAKLKLYTTIGNIAMDYYEGLIRTGVFKLSITGDKTIDRIFERMIVRIFDSPTTHKFFIDNIEKVLDGKMKKVFDDTQYDDMVNEDVIEKAASFVGKKFGGRETKLRWKVLDNAISLLPNINKSLKKEIKDMVFSSDYNRLLKLYQSNKKSAYADALVGLVLKYMVKNTTNRFNDNGDDFLREFLKTLGSALTSTNAADFFKKNLKSYLISGQQQ